jgi:hypothetical protein
VAWVAADVVLPSLSDHLKIGERHQWYPLPAARIDPVAYSRVAWVKPAYCRQLQTQSDRRCAVSPEFTRLKADIARLDRRQQRKTIPLTEEGVREATDPIDESDKKDSTAVFPLTPSNY